MEDQILEVLIWKLFELNDKINSHTHSSPFDLIGMQINKKDDESESPTIPNEYVKLFLYEKELSKKLDSMRYAVVQFDKFKASILETECPIITIRNNLAKMEQELLEVTEKLEKTKEKEVREHPE